MARQPMVSRTFLTTRAKVLAINVQTEESFYADIVLPRTYKDEQHLMKVIREVFDNDVQKAAHIMSVTVEKTRYGMSESEFIQHSRILPLLKHGENDEDIDETADDVEG